MSEEKEGLDFRENEKLVGMVYVLMSLQEKDVLTSMEREALNYAISFLVDMYGEVYGGVPAEEGEEEKAKGSVKAKGGIKEATAAEVIKEMHKSYV